MGLFQQRHEEKRDIEDILTPKEKNEIVEDIDDNDKIENESKNEVEYTTKALHCFGWQEMKTEKWLINCAKVWYGIASIFWFLFGAFTFAPIVFISDKVNVFFKNKKKSIFVGIGIYALIVALIVFFIIAKTKK